MTLPRYYPIVDRTSVQKLGLDAVEVALQMCEGGAKIFQYRDKGQVMRSTVDILMRMSGLGKNFGAVFVVNDRPDLAKMFQAAVHLGQSDLPPAAARSIVGAQATIGLSTHNEAQLRAADREAVDYVAIGPIFGTESKERPDPVVGLAELSRLRSLTKKPLVAIGGITRANARSVFESGADSVAVISDAIPADGSIRARTAEWIQLLG